MPRTHLRALRLLASAGVEGCSEAVMLANGISVEQMVELVRGEYASVTPTRIRAGRETLEVAVMRISEKGRRALAAAEG